MSAGQHAKPPVDGTGMGTGTDVADTHMTSRPPADPHSLTRKRACMRGPRTQQAKKKVTHTHTSYSYTHQKCSELPTLPGQHSQPEWAAHWTGRLTLLRAHSGLDQRWESQTVGTERRRGNGGTKREGWEEQGVAVEGTNA